MNGLSLFTGSGIGELAFKLIFPDYRTIGYVEWDKYCQSILKARIRDGILDDAPIFGDIRQFNERYASLYAGRVDWLSGGPPCQPFSIAGSESRGAGEADERDCFPDFLATVRICRPRYVLCENVPNLPVSHGRYFGRVLAGLSSLGYDLEWDIVPASFVGAGHTRHRVWILANAQGIGRQRSLDGSRESDSQRAERDSIPTKRISAFNARQFREQVRTTEFIRTANGIPNRMDRIRACGNGWVPQVVARILQVTGAENR
jgi:DNA (cytosine-5)-methyltransferase 1